MPADEEDSLSKVLADAAAALLDRVDGAREHPSVRRAREMIAGLEWLATSTDPKRPDNRDER